MNVEKFEYHIEQTNDRLDKIEQKIDILLETRGQTKAMMFLLTTIVSAVTSLLTGKIGH